jgi:endonuclease/exonuclease/phosphatase family metal-dependent hydrolase
MRLLFRNTFLFSCVGAAVLAAACSCRFPFTGRGEELVIVTYNVQNLFDDVDNGGEYPEYDPGRGEWDTRLFHRRLLALARTLRSFPQGGADVILLQEVENVNVLEQLREHYLHGGGYAYSAVTAAPDSPINLAFLSRLPPVGLKVHGITVNGEPAGRPLMELQFDCGGQRLILLHCHWKSKRGGAEETEELRRAAAAAAAERIAALQRRHPGAAIIIAGDLNENADEWSRCSGAYPTALMPASAVTSAAPTDPAAHRAELYVTGDRDLWRSAPAPGNGAPAPLYSPWLAGDLSAEGSFHYDGQWETIDQFLLHPALGDGEGLEYAGCRACTSPRLLSETGTPLRWITRTERGCSDHLPLLLRVVK